MNKQGESAVKQPVGPFWRQQSGDLVWHEAPLLEDGAVAAVSTRHGGVSGAGFATLNLSLSVADVPENVQENRARFFGALRLSADRIVSVPQVHGTRIAYAVEANAGERPTEPLGDADGLVTDRPNLGLFLRFADCVPLLAVDPVRRVVGIAHAGWRGSLAGIAGELVRALEERFDSQPRNLRLAIGPSIGPCCYEVGPEIRSEFCARWDFGPELSREVDGRWHLDLWETNRRQLLAAGVPGEQIVLAGMCTSCRVHEFFSHRAQAGHAGRFGAIVALKEAN